MVVSCIGILFSSLRSDTHYSNASGNWNAPSSWSGTRGGVAGITFPVAGDIVYIENGHSITLTADGACQTLYLGGQSGGTGNGTLVFNSGVTLTTAGNINNYGPNGNGNIIMTAGGTIQCGGGFTSPAGNTFAAGSGTFVYNGTDQNVYGTTYNNLSFSGSGTKTLSGTVTVNGNMVIGSGVTPALGANTLNLNANLSNSGNAMTGTGTVNAGGLVTQTIAGFSTSGDVTINNKSTNVVTFIGDVSGKDLVVAAGTLNLGIELSHTFSTLNVDGTLQCESSTLNLTLSGSTSPVSAIGTIIMNTGTFNYSGAAQKIYATTYNNLTLSGTGGKTFPVSTTTTVNGTLSIENGAYANTFNGSLAYGPAASLKYNTAAARTTSTEWPASFSTTGGVHIWGTGKITTSGNKVSAGSYLWVHPSAVMEVASDLTTKQIVIQGTITFANSAAITASDRADVYMTGSWDGTNAGSFSLGTLSTYDNFIAGTAVYTFTQTEGFITCLGWSATIPNVMINGTCTLQGALTVSASLGGTGTLTLSEDSGALSIGGTCTVSSLNAAASGCSVTYSGAAQTVRGCSYSHLTLSGSGVKTFQTGTSVAGNMSVSGTAEAVLAEVISVGGNLTVGSGSTLTLGIYTANRSLPGGILTVAGTLKVGGVSNFPANYSSFVAAGGTVNYNSGWSQEVWSTTYNNLTFSGSGEKTISGVTVGGVLSIEGTATTNNHPLSGGWLQYNTSVSRTAGPEWYSVGLYSGGIIIANTGTITTNENKSNIQSLTIQSGATLAVGANYSFDVDGAATVNGTLKLAGTGVKSFIGDVTINPGGVWNETGAGSVVFGGNVTNNASAFTANTGDHQFGIGLGDFTISGSTALSIPNVTFKYANYTNAGTLSAGTSLTVASGNFIQGINGILNIGGSVTGTLLTMAFGNTINYTGAAQTVLGINYYHLTLSGSGAKTLQNGTSYVWGNLTLSGTASASLVKSIINSGNLTIGSGATLTLGQFYVDNQYSGGTVIVAGTLYVGSLFPEFFTTFTSAGGTVIYNGALWSSQKVYPGTYDNLTINNADDGISLDGAVTVNGTLTLTDGIVNTTSTNSLTIGSAGSISGGSEASHVNGPLSMQRSATGQHSDVYPIGKGGIYRPVTLNLNQSTTTLSTYTAEMFNGAPTANSLPGSLANVSGVRYYSISEGTGGSAFTAGTVLLNYGSDDLVSNYANLRIAQGPAAGGGTWTNLAGAGTANTIGTITSTTAFTSLTNTVFVLANASTFYATLRAWLQGPFTGDAMRTTQSPFIPLTAPFTENPRTVTQIPAGAVDWILVQLRSGDKTTVVKDSALFIRQDGYVMDESANTCFALSCFAEGDYYVVLKQRNHLAAMSSIMLHFGSAATAVFDFTTSAAQFAGGQGCSQLSNGQWGLCAGDITQDGRITTHDYAAWFNQNRRLPAVYQSADLNLDGQVNIDDFTLWQENARGGAHKGF